jgi:NTE family protein
MACANAGKLRIGCETPYTLSNAWTEQPCGGDKMAGQLAVVLAGGGAPAAYFGAGAIQAIEDAGLKPGILSGVSAGAINACAVGSGMTANDLAKMWCHIRWSDLYRPRTDLWNAVNVRRLFRPTTNVAEWALNAVGWTHLLDVEPSRHTLEQEFGGPDIRPVRGRTVVLSAVDPDSGEPVRYCTRLPPTHRRDKTFRQVDLGVGHIMAAAAVPLLFPPGTDVERSPLAPVLAYEPDRVIVVSGAGMTRPGRTPDSLGETVSQLVDDIARSALHADLAHARTVNRLARAAPTATRKRDVPMLLIEPTDAGLPADRFLRFTSGQARAMLDYGRERAEKALAGWDF